MGNQARPQFRWPLSFYETLAVMFLAWIAFKITILSEDSAITKEWIRATDKRLNLLENRAHELFRYHPNPHPTPGSSRDLFNQFYLPPDLRIFGLWSYKKL